MSVYLPRMIDGNVLVGDRGAHGAVFRVDTVSWPYLTGKKAWWSRLAYMAYEARASFSVYVVNRMLDTDRYVQQAMELLDPRFGTGELYEQFVRGHRDHLDQRGRFNPEAYVIVQLPEPTAGGLGQQLARDLDGWRRRMERAGGLGPRPVLGHVLTELRRSRDQARDRLARRVPARDATTREVLWLFRRLGMRGWMEPPLDDHWEPNALELTGPDGAVVYETHGHDLERLLIEQPVEQDGLLRVDCGEHGELWQAMLTLGAYPEEVEFPGDAEMVYAPREQVNFPVDTVIHCDWVSNRDAMAKIRRKVRDAHVALQDQAAASHGELSWQPSETVQDALAAEKYTRSQAKPPWLRVAVSFAVPAHPDPNVVRERVDAFRAQFGTVMLHQPPEQAALYWDHALRPDGGDAARKWRDWWTVEQFAGLTPFGTHELSARRGVYFAHVVNGSERPLLANLREAGQEDRSGSWLLAGTTGSGKTMTAELLLLIAALQGSLVLDLDYKGDHKLHEVPWLAGRVGVIDLDDPERYQGLLDPLIIVPKSRRVDVAHSYLMTLLYGMPAAWSTPVLKAVQDTVDEDQRPALSGVLRRLLAPDAGAVGRDAGEALQVRSRSGLARFAFSTGEHQDLELRDQVTMIRPGALQLPGSDVALEAYDPVERLSLATFKLIAQLMIGMTRRDRTLHKVVHLDEAHHFFDNPQGRRTVSDFNREYRYWWTTLLMSTQHVADPGKIVDLVGTVLAFGTENMDEARAELATLGLDADSDDLAEMLQALRQGGVLIRDMHGKVARGQVDHVYPELLDALRTSAGRRDRVIA